MCTPTVTPTNKQTDKDDRGSDTNVSTDRASEEEDGSPDNSEIMWSDNINTYKETLYNIADDLTDRLMEDDHNLISGVVKFSSCERPGSV